MIPMFNIPNLTSADLEVMREALDYFTQFEEGSKARHAFILCHKVNELMPPLMKEEFINPITPAEAEEFHVVTTNWEDPD